MLAKDNEYLEAAANSLFEANEERMVRERCIARKLAERRERTLERDIKLLKESNTTLSKEISALGERNSTLETQNSSLEAQNSSLETQNSSLEARIKELEALLGESAVQK